MRDFRDLKVWQKSHELTLEVYKATSKFPKSEIYGLSSQLRRASASVPTNIAEGCGRVKMNSNNLCKLQWVQLRNSSIF
jgi:four helix bundle protein